MARQFSTLSHIPPTHEHDSRIRYLRVVWLVADPNVEITIATRWINQQWRRHALLSHIRLICQIHAVLRRFGSSKLECLIPRARARVNSMVSIPRDAQTY